MARFDGTPIISVSQVGARMQIAVEYNVIYSSEELDFPEGFVNSVEILEDDSGEPFGGADDHIFNFAISAPFFPKSTRETHRRESNSFY